MAKVRVQAAELSVLESVEDVMTRVSNAAEGLQVEGSQVAGPGWISLTDARTNRELYVQVGQIGYVGEDD